MMWMISRISMHWIMPTRNSYSPIELCPIRTAFDIDFVNDVKLFHHLVQLEGMAAVSLGYSLLSDLTKLRYFAIDSYRDEEVKMNP